MLPRHKTKGSGCALMACLNDSARISLNLRNGPRSGPPMSEWFPYGWAHDLTFCPTCKSPGLKSNGDQMIEDFQRSSQVRVEMRLPRSCTCLICTAAPPRVQYPGPR